MITCSKNGCGRRPLMDGDRCFDHQKVPGDRALGFLVGLYVLLSLAFVGVGVWAVIELVQWVTSQ